MKKMLLKTVLSISLIVTSCSKDDSSSSSGKDINTAERVSIDRFSASAGHLMVRNAINGLPAANAPINFDNQPFITSGLDRTGAIVKYYNFDIQPTTPAPIYVFFKTGQSTPLSGQNNVVGLIPGNTSYNDFWNVVKVIVPNNYVANTITNEASILNSNFEIEETNVIVNCPIVPFGSTASRSSVAGQASELTLGWFNDKAVAYFNFNEAPITANSTGMVPTSPIFVMFNDNSAGPASGFVAETGTMQTHNVLGTLPTDSSYSPLWSVQVLDNMYFNSVSNLTTATSFMSMAAGANVNCPVVK